MRCNRLQLSSLDNDQLVVTEKAGFSSGSVSMSETARLRGRGSRLPYLVGGCGPQPEPTPRITEVPPAWPRLLNRDQLRAYLGGMAEATLVRICPVPPIQLGVSLVRYDRVEVDAWLDTLPPRFLLGSSGGSSGASTPEQVQLDDQTRTLSAVERARARAEKARSRKLN